VRGEDRKTQPTDKSTNRQSLRRSALNDGSQEEESTHNGPAAASKFPLSSQ